MGFDVFGYENNAYFRNNIWWWRPLWSYVSSVSKNVLSKEDMDWGFFNEGHHINGKKTKNIIRILEKELVEDKLKNKSISDIIENIPMAFLQFDACLLRDTKPCEPGYQFDINNVIKFVDFLKKTKGGFVIW